MTASASFRIRAIVAACSLAFVSAAAAPAHADDCKPLTLITSVEMTPGPNGGNLSIPVTLGTTKTRVLVSTTTAYSQLEPTAVAKAGLKSYPNYNSFEQPGLAPRVNIVADAIPFVIGRLTFASKGFVVERGGGDESDIGELGADVLTNYDVDFDFGAGKFSLLSQDHCEGRVVYWPAAAVAVVPIRVSELGTVSFPATLDGHQVRAELATEAPHTVLVRSVADSFGLQMGSADTPAIGNADWAPTVTLYRHRFASLSLEGISVNNIDIKIAPNPNGEGKDSLIGTHLYNPNPFGDHPDLYIGMDVLKHLHVYIAYHEQELYITPASAPAPAPQATTSSPAAPAASQAAH